MRPKKVILLVDDDENRLSILKFLLETNSYRVVAAGGGKLALAEFLATPAIDLVIAEASMPQISGEQLIARLKKIRPYIPMVLLVGPGVVVSPESLDDGMREHSHPSVQLLDWIKIKTSCKRGPRNRLPYPPPKIPEVSTGFIHRNAPAVQKRR